MSEYAKAIVAVILSAIGLFEIFSGFSFGIGKEWGVAAVLVLTPILVLLTPNKSGRT